MADEEKKKEKRPTAKKRDLQNEKKRLRNKILKSRVRTVMRDFEESLTTKEGGAEKLKSVYSFLDRSVKQKIFKANKASRLKSRAAAKLTSK